MTGVPADLKEAKTVRVHDNGFNPSWIVGGGGGGGEGEKKMPDAVTGAAAGGEGGEGHVVEFDLHAPELAIMSFEVWDYDATR
jgi:hypothetical protein